MSIPCEHIIACLVHIPETETNKAYQENLPYFFNRRWEFGEELESEKLLNFIQDFQFNKKILNQKENNQFTKDNKDSKKVKIILPPKTAERKLFQEFEEESDAKENKLTNQTLSNPVIVKTCGRPIQEKRTPSYFERNKPYKRKSEESSISQTKAIKLFERNCF